MAGKDSWDLDDHRRFAHQLLPPGELRDGYLGYLDALEPREPAEGPGQAGREARPPGSTAAEPRREGHGAAGGRGFGLLRVVLVAAGSVAFAYGTWVLTSLL